MVVFQTISKKSFQTIPKESFQTIPKESFQYVSDLHLEHYDHTNYNKIIKPNPNNYLILAGDICPIIVFPFYFLKWCSKNFKKVFYIPGNHEFWGTSISKSKKLFKKFCNYCNVIGLDNDVYEGDTFRIIGSTLWSNIPSDLTIPITNKMNDYKRICNHKVSDTNRMHNNCVEFIKNSIKNDKIFQSEKSKINIVVTHHGPVRELTSAPKYRGTWSNVAYASDVIDVVKLSDYWVFGHTHYCINFEVDNCKVMSNCYGYTHETTKYENDRCFEI